MSVGVGVRCSVNVGNYVTMIISELNINKHFFK